ncbi:hypothetical protein Thit_2091 [Thermoanaerobacter italicus Ab9]|uniref:Lipoprotein n=1 Tax=Thermoanaerobacter italicus (strain DSM 9252 / Ab9) TaxID=580331 RepID=D3T525_THEIA|nr:hypothetical protein [Thermoanaerobacter italicus]ADD03318.1 hypothetical protein Thit_2091 [Thermoanaerobacter italicus Ab9]
MKKILILAVLLPLLISSCTFTNNSVIKNVDQQEEENLSVSNIYTATDKFSKEDFQRVLFRYEYIGVVPLFDGTFVVAFGFEPLSQAYGKIHLALFKKTDKTWNILWELPEPVETDIRGEPPATSNADVYIDHFVLQDKNTALVTLTLGSVTNRGYTTLVVFTVGRDGKIKLHHYDFGEVNSLLQNSLVKKGNTIEIAWKSYTGPYGLYNFSLKDSKYNEEWIPASIYKPEGDIGEAKFLIGTKREGYIILPAESPVIEARVGETIVFVPSNFETARMLDNGEIEFYVGEDSYVAPCSACRIIGNSYTFNKPGEFLFLLTCPKLSEDLGIESTDTKPTFRVYVKP